MGEACHHDKQHADDDDRGGTDTREGFLGIKDSRQVKNGYGTQKHQVSTQLGKQQDGKHGKYGPDSNPGMEIKSPKNERFQNIISFIKITQNYK